MRREKNSVRFSPQRCGSRIFGLKLSGSQAARIPAAVDRKNIWIAPDPDIRAPADEGITTDELMVGAGLESTALREALHSSDRWAFPATTRRPPFVHVAVENALEEALRGGLRTRKPRYRPTGFVKRHRCIAGDGYPLNLRLLAQRIKG